MAAGLVNLGASAPLLRKSLITPGWKGRGAGGQVRVFIAISGIAGGSCACDSCAISGGKNFRATWRPSFKFFSLVDDSHAALARLS
jgi:hypothetical protein